MRSFNEEFDDLYRCAYQAAFRLLADREESQDIAQEALARASVRWSAVSEFGQAWVARVAMNLALDFARRRKRRLREEVPPAPRRLIEDVVGDRLNLLDALLSLSRRQRQVVCLRYIADLPEGAVSHLLGCSVGTVKSHASRGVSHLRHHLTEGSNP